MIMKIYIYLRWELIGHLGEVYAETALHPELCAFWFNNTLESLLRCIRIRKISFGLLAIFGPSSTSRPPEAEGWIVELEALGRPGSACCRSRKMTKIPYTVLRSKRSKNISLCQCRKYFPLTPCDTRRASASAPSVWVRTTAELVYPGWTRLSSSRPSPQAACPRRLTSVSTSA